ncbi:MAG: ABC-2 family transporter protein [Candidatus Aenigmatarchaeota archaeon]
MRKYLELLRTSFKQSAAYRFEFAIYLIATLVSMSVFFFVWTAIYTYNQTETLGGLTLQQMITYVVVSMAIVPVIWNGADRMIYWDINQGQITNTLTKPLKIQTYIFFRESGSNILAFFTQTLPALILAFFIFKISVPSVIEFAAFSISVLLSLLISFSIAFLVYLSAFWTEKSDGIRRLKEAVIDLFSGFLIPIYLFPLWMQPIFFMLPFQAIFNTPLSIFIGKISGTRILFAIAVQIFWAAVLLLAGHLIWKKARIKYTAHGG